MVESSIAAIIAAISAATGIALTVLYNHLIDTRKRRRKERDVVGRYRDALLYASEELQTPLIYLCTGRVPVKPEGANTPDSESAQGSYHYYHLIYLIARLFCWTYIIQNDIRNVHYSPTKQDHRIMNILYDITLTLADDKTIPVDEQMDAVEDETKSRSLQVPQGSDDKISADKKTHDKSGTVAITKVTINEETKRKPPFQVLKGFQAAIGEKMTSTSNGINHCIGYAEFWSRWIPPKPPGPPETVTKVPFTIWFKQVEDGLLHLKEHDGQNALWRTDRIKKFQHHLCDLAQELDPDRLRIHRHTRIRWEPGQQAVRNWSSASRISTIKLGKRTMSRSSYNNDERQNRQNRLKPFINNGVRLSDRGAGPSNSKVKLPEAQPMADMLRSETFDHPDTELFEEKKLPLDSFHNNV